MNTLIIEEFEEKDTNGAYREYVRFKCDFCGKEHKKQKGQLKVKNFCSYECSSYSRRGKHTYEEVKALKGLPKIKICPKCGIEHEKEGKFCSRKCANSRTWTEEDNIKKSASAK